MERRTRRQGDTRKSRGPPPPYVALGSLSDLLFFRTSRLPEPSLLPSSSIRKGSSKSAWSGPDPRRGRIYTPGTPKEGKDSIVHASELLRICLKER